jgi:hypothetical protein
MEVAMDSGITWPRDRRGPVKIRGRLRFAGGAGVPFDLAFKRWWLEGSLRTAPERSLTEARRELAAAIAGALDTYAWGVAHPDPHVKVVRVRKPRRVCRVMCFGAPAWIAIDREHLRELYRHRPPGLSSAIAAQLPLRQLLEQARDGRPIGRAASNRFMAVASRALYMADRLARSKDRGLQQRVRAVLKAGGWVHRTRRATALALLERALRPAWGRIKLPTYERDPADAYKVFLPVASKRRLAVTTTTDDESRWFELLLGPEGDVARASGLL